MCQKYSAYLELAVWSLHVCFLCQVYETWVYCEVIAMIRNGAPTQQFEFDPNIVNKRWEDL